MRDAVLNGANLENSILKRCLICGISAWNINLKGAVQEHLDISLDHKPSVHVNDLRLAYVKNLTLKDTEDIEIQNIINQPQKLLEKKVVRDKSNI